MGRDKSLLPHEDSCCVGAAIGLSVMFPWMTLTVMYLGSHVLFTPHSYAEFASHTYKHVTYTKTGEKIEPLKLSL